MKAVLEKIEPIFGNSFTVKQFDEKHSSNNKPYWHFHPEYEIVYISNGSGKRHIGDHLSYFEDGDLILLGPNLPHFGFSGENYAPHTEIVVQMQEDFLGKEFMNKPEMMAIKQLFDRSRQGISFKGDTRRNLGQRIEGLVQLDHFNRLLELLSILQELARSEEYELFNAIGFALEVSTKDQERIHTVYDYVATSFQEEVKLDEAAKLVSMTVPAFCRYFKKLTHKTFSQFVNEYRVNHACRLLADEDMSIALISLESGFNNLSHFNRQFKSITNLNPRDYRKNIKKLVD
jgi:AraC-like DNA-binding protein